VSDIKRNIAKNISNLRTANRLTQLELAEKLSYSDKAISKWERGESIPDIVILYQIAELFQVSIDYLVNDHDDPKKDIKELKRIRATTQKNHAFITGMCVILVWLIATLLFAIFQIVFDYSIFHCIVFIYAIPISMVIWLIFNSIWFDKRKNFLIISLLMWTFLISLCVTLASFGARIWLLALLGIPGQIIIIMWSKLSYKIK